MNKSRWIAASLAVFVAAMLLEALYNAYCLKAALEQVAFLWRPQGEMMKLAPLYWVSAFIVSFIFVYIYAKGYEGKSRGWAEGLRFGLWFGLFMSLTISASSYVTMPITHRLAADWFITNMAEYLICGAIAGAIYKPAPSAAA